MSGIVDFPGARPDRDWSMIYCAWCRSTAVRLVARGASSEYEVRCHNCNTVLEDLAVIERKEEQAHAD